MPIIEFSERDLLRGTVVEPAWYRIHIEEIDAEGQLSKDQRSTNYNVEATILFNGDNGDMTYTGIPITWNFNSKALGFARGLFEALSIVLKPRERYRLEFATGKDVDVYIGNKPYEGRILNDINHKYRKPREGVVGNEATRPKRDE